MKYGDNENKKCDFQGWFCIFIGSFGHFILKIIKRSSENAILVKKYGILDFRGSFGNFSARFQRDGENDKIFYFQNFFFKFKNGQK